jgi:hypothetical protein
MKKIILLLSILSITFLSTAQRVDYDQNRNIFFGFNIGHTWHTSDVQNIEDRFPLGAGFIFGGSFNNKPGRRFSFDLRLRYLGGAWYGQDTDTTSVIDGNNAVNNIYDTLGFATQNFRAGQHHLGLELAIHANRFRERTGLDPYIFGGIGVVGTRTKGDLLNNNIGYNYDLDPSGSQIAGNYDTPLDLNNNGDAYDDVIYEGRFVPSLGFGLGYYFTNRFSFGFEHKSTFFMGDFFDGTTFNQNGEVSSPFTNDIYHYTSVYFRWYLRRGHTSTSGTTHTQTQTVVDNTPVNNGQNLPPRVTFTSPSSNPHTTNSTTFTLRANVEQINSSNDISFWQNGQRNPSFTYNPMTDRFQANVQLKPGQNTFRVRGTNVVGSDEATMIIFYQRDNNTPAAAPVVEIIDPSTNPLTVNNRNYNLRATIEEVSNSQNVSVLVNNQSFTNFNFTPFGVGNFTANLSLQPGLNTIQITGTNANGVDTDQTTIIYRAITNMSPPLVNITNPSYTPFTVANSTFNLRGTVARVNDRNAITFIQNGVQNSNFSFNPNSMQFSSNVVLQPGENVFQLIGSNNAGTDQEVVIINYTIANPKPPIVTITKPVADPHVTYNATQSFQANILNVTNQSQVSMSLNGNNYTNYNFDPSTGVLTSVLPLQIGTNTVSVTATNNDGTDSEQTTIVYRKATQPQPPIIEFVVPTSNPFTTFSQTQLINATVLNVSSQNQINVFVNGSAYTNFNFNTNLQLCSFTASLIEGANTITITANNNDGTASETTTVIYKTVSKPNPPVVSFIDPISNPKTVYNPVYNVTAKVEHVDNANDIQVKINGNVTSNFNFSNSAEEVTFNANLVNGANTIEVRGTNQYGQDIASTTLVYKRSSSQKAPEVTIFIPTTDPFTSTQSTKQVYATVLNVTNAQAINVSVNGTSLNTFAYNNSTKQVTFTANLIEGSNNVVVSANNNAGSDSDNTTIIYDKDDVVLPPFVTFINPPSSGYFVSSPSFQMVAEVENVTSKNDIDVQFNGNVISSNLFSFDPSTKEVKYVASLTEGNNLFQVQGTNSAGSHQAATNVLYKAPDPGCDDPEINFTSPSNTGIQVNTDFYNVKAIINNVDNQNNITFKVNGNQISSFSYNQASHELIRKVDLIEGNNLIEISAQNDCGQVTTTIIINYVKPTAPCSSPEINPINPLDDVISTMNSTLNFIVGLSHIEDAKQVKLLVNGTQTNFNFDLGTHELEGLISLNEGNNTVVVIAQNDCAVAKKSWSIKRKVCKKPTLNLNTSPSIGSAPLTNDAFQINGTISDTENAGIAATFNGKPVNYVYAIASGRFSMQVQLVKGNNTLVILAKNECGQTEQVFNVNYKPIVVPKPPSVSITQPTSNPFNTNKPNQTVLATTTNITSSGQINVMVNGINSNFNFDATNGIISFNASLTEGNNTVSITVNNADGTATDDLVINYTIPVVVDPPVVSFSFPDVTPKEVSPGVHTVVGFVTNIDAVNQLQVLVNQQVYSNYSTNIQSNGIAFSFDLSFDPAHPNYNITAIGTNSAGSDNETVYIALAQGNSNCTPSISTNFSADHKSMTTNSSIVLSNVVLKFSDQSTQKFEPLSGNTASLSGTGTHQGKCIIGAWVKSGCNESGDGPGYGEWFANTNYDGSCETPPCDPPSINLVSSTTSTNLNYNLQVFVDNVTANQVTITHNGQPINCSYSSSSQTFECSVTLLLDQSNTFVVEANGCDTVTETFNVMYDNPCIPVTYNRIYPTQTTETVTNDNITITLSAEHQTSTQVTVNNSNFTNFSVSGGQISLNNVPLNQGANNIVVNLSNPCSQESLNYSITYNAPPSCGPRFNPGNSSWQFCLITPSGTYTRDDLVNNPNFNYTGPASSLYILATVGGSDATVGGSPFTVQPGKYHRFSGILNVSVSSNHPGSNGQWQVCINADRPPISGNVSNRPMSPCETKIQNGGRAPTRVTKPNTNTVTKPVREEKPSETKPTRTSPSRKTPSRTEESSGRKPSNARSTKEEKEEQPIRERGSSKKPEENTGSPNRRAPSRTPGGGL